MPLPKSNHAERQRANLDVFRWAFVGRGALGVHHLMTAAPNHCRSAISGSCSSAAQQGACLQRLGRMLGAVVNRVCWARHNAYPLHTWQAAHPAFVPCPYVKV